MMDVDTWGPAGRQAKSERAQRSRAKDPRPAPAPVESRRKSRRPDLSRFLARQSSLELVERQVENNGSKEPITRNDTDQGRQRNRRVVRQAGAAQAVGGAGLGTAAVSWRVPAGDRDSPAEGRRRPKCQARDHLVPAGPLRARHLGVAADQQRRRAILRGHQILRPHYARVLLRTLGPE